MIKQFLFFFIRAVKSSTLQSDHRVSTPPGLEDMYPFWSKHFFPVRFETLDLWDSFFISCCIPNAWPISWASIWKEYYSWNHILIKIYCNQDWLYNTGAGVYRSLIFSDAKLQGFVKYNMTVTFSANQVFIEKTQVFRLLPAVHRHVTHVNKCCQLLSVASVLSGN